MMKRPTKRRRNFAKQGRIIIAHGLSRSCITNGGGSCSCCRKCYSCGRRCRYCAFPGHNFCMSAGIASDGRQRGGARKVAPQAYPGCVTIQTSGTEVLGKATRRNNLPCSYARYTFFGTGADGRRSCRPHRIWQRRAPNFISFLDHFMLRAKRSVS